LHLSSKAHDSQNNLFAVYDLYDFSPVTWGVYATIVINEGSSWQNPNSLAEGLGTKVVVGNNDRVYVFWYQGAPHNGEFCYQYLENGKWSEIFIPFDDPNTLTGLWEIEADSGNNLHCGGYYDPTGYASMHPAYYRFDYTTQTWDSITILSNGTSTSDIDIAMDNVGLPHICWSESDTYYSTFDGQNWTVADTAGHRDSQRVEIVVDDVGKIHIATTETYSGFANLLYYHRPDGVNWENMIVDQCTNVIFTPEFEIFENQLYALYDKSDVVPRGDIYISKLDILSDIFEHNCTVRDMKKLKAFPNPFKQHTNIFYSIDQPGFVKICIIGLNGKLINTLFVENQIPGNHIVQWDGKDSQIQMVSPGIYFCVINTPNHQLIDKIIYVQ